MAVPCAAQWQQHRARRDSSIWQSFPLLTGLPIDSAHGRIHAVAGLLAGRQSDDAAVGHGAAGAAAAVATNCGRARAGIRNLHPGGLGLACVAVGQAVDATLGVVAAAMGSEKRRRLWGAE